MLGASCRAYQGAVTYTSSLQVVSPSEKVAAYAKLTELLAEARQKTLDAYAPTIRSSATWKARAEVGGATLTASCRELLLVTRGTRWQRVVEP